MRNRGQLFALGRIAGSFALPKGYEFHTHMLINLSENLWPNSNNQFSSSTYQNPSQGIQRIRSCRRSSQEAFPTKLKQEQRNDYLQLAAWPWFKINKEQWRAIGLSSYSEFGPCSEKLVVIHVNAMEWIPCRQMLVGPVKVGFFYGLKSKTQIYFKI